MASIRTSRSSTKTRKSKKTGKDRRSRGKADARRGESSAARKSDDLVAVRDELNDLAAILACLPELRAFVAMMDEIINPPASSSLEPTHDRIGWIVRKLTKGHVDHAGSTVDEVSNLTFDASDVTDMHRTIDVIDSVVQYRLRRVSKLLATL